MSLQEGPGGSSVSLEEGPGGSGVNQEGPGGSSMSLQEISRPGGSCVSLEEGPGGSSVNQEGSGGSSVSLEKGPGGSSVSLEEGTGGSSVNQGGPGGSSMSLQEGPGGSSVSLEEGPGGSSVSLEEGPGGSSVSLEEGPDGLSQEGPGGLSVRLEERPGGSSVSIEDGPGGSSVNQEGPGGSNLQSQEEPGSSVITLQEAPGGSSVSQEEGQGGSRVSLERPGGSIGTCTVCRRGGFRVVNGSGLLWKHGPRGNLCMGSHTRPALGSVSAAPMLSVHRASIDGHPLTANLQPIVSTHLPDPSLSFSTTSWTTSGEPVSIKHMEYGGPILKRIPKGARSAVAEVLERLIRDTLHDPSSTEPWLKLLGFSSCLARPKRGGKSRNLTTQVIKLVRSYDSGDGVVTKEGLSEKRRVLKTQTFNQAAASRASVKLEEGDVKGAVRLLCSNDSLAKPDEATYRALIPLHPAAPADRRITPVTNTVTPLQTTPGAIIEAVRTFPNGSAAGPDGLRPQHLKDLLAGSQEGDPLLAAVTDFINFILEGKTPSFVRGALFGATLLAIGKKCGGVRPIAVGYVWRRLAAKVACRHVRDRASQLLAPHQLGFGVSGGAESAVRAARRFVENMTPGQVFMKLDFKNAFNTLRRDTILEAVSRHFPEMLPFASSTLTTASVLQFGKFSISSEEGAQQGDPLGPLYFCITIHDVIRSLRSELILAYLDDVTLGGSAEDVAQDFVVIEKEAAKLGLMLNRSKCELSGHTEASRKRFQTLGITVPEVNTNDVMLLGAPLSVGRQLDLTLSEKREELQTLASRLPLMPAHDSLYLLRNVLTAPRMLYLLRTAPCTGSNELQLYDDLLRDTTSMTLNVDLSGNRWRQASLAVRWGGLGIRGVVLLAPSAYLASAAATKDLTQRLLPVSLRDSEDSGLAPAMAAWLTNTSGANPPAHPSASRQRSWDDISCKAVADDLLSNAQDMADRARLIASVAEGSGDWLEALPLLAIGLKLDNAAVRIAVGLRLGAPLMHPHTCVCGTAVMSDGRHGLACRKSAGRHSRHSQINDLLLRAFSNAGVLATREPHGLCTQAGKRPDGVTSIPWQRGRCLAWDATCPDTFAQSHLQSTSTTAGAAATTAEAAKRVKYADIMATIDFTPVAIETSGAWGSEGLALVNELGRRAAALNLEPRSTAFLRQRLSLAIQRGNAYCVLATNQAETSNVDS
jgi:Reverse transcriptase (RNA-dependent DNA polymerase)